MQTTQHSTPCPVYVIPARSITPDDVFKVRRAAEAAGCKFVSTRPRFAVITGNGPFGGDAA